METARRPLHSVCPRGRNGLPPLRGWKVTRSELARRWKVCRSGLQPFRRWKHAGRMPNASRTRVEAAPSRFVDRNRLNLHVQDMAHTSTWPTSRVVSGNISGRVNHAKSPSVDALSGAAWMESWIVPSGLLISRRVAPGFCRCVGRKIIKGCERFGVAPGICRRMGGKLAIETMRAQTPLCRGGPAPPRGWKRRDRFADHCRVAAGHPAAWMENRMLRAYRKITFTFFLYYGLIAK
jgi:hypothetical protein